MKGQTLWLLVLGALIVLLAWWMWGELSNLKKAVNRVAASQK